MSMGYLPVSLKHLQFPFSMFFTFQCVSFTSLIGLFLGIFFVDMILKGIIFFPLTSCYFIVSVKKRDRFLCANLTSCRLPEFISQS